MDDDSMIAERVAALAKPIWNECYKGIITQGQIDYMVSEFQSEGSIRKDLENGYVYHIIVSEGKDVGYCGFAVDGDSVYLSKFYIEKGCRGKGLGRKALSVVERYATDNGKKRIHLRVNRNNTNSIAAYQKFGFRKYKEDVSDIGNGFVMDDFLMEKIL